MPTRDGTIEILPVEGEAAFWDDRDAVRTALAGPAPRIPPWFGYDEVGSELFEAITALPTYHLTRVEHALLQRHAAEIAAALGCGRLVELGSGSARKTRLLLAACLDRGPTTYLPVDVSREMLDRSAAALVAELPGLTVQGLWGRYEAGLARLRADRAGPTVVAFLGSNLGNATDPERHALLAEIAATLAPGDGFLVSADLRKPAEVFDTCYNDPPGHTAFADFRLNHLTHLNRRFGADFAMEYFYPRARCDDAGTVVAGHLHATEDQTVRLPGLDLTLRLREGDGINVGFSAKFHRPTLVAELHRHGLDLQHQWIDPVWQYGLFLARRE
jgi:L-histidine Nalpha-methyltransferase